MQSNINFARLIILLLVSPLTAIAESQFSEMSEISISILKLKPDADQDKDGKLSQLEFDKVQKRVLKKFPNIDVNKDGKLSEKETTILLKFAQKKQRRNESTMREYPIEPSFSDFAYGDHQRQVMDVWLADSKKQTPVAVYIHGGGFMAGSKEKLRDEELKSLLDAGISVISINYRYKNTHPLPAAHYDAKRALQTVRSKSAEWNLDKHRIGVFGGSAGAQVCMWLAYSDQMADPKSNDPIDRESSRVTCVATSGGQTNLDAKVWQELVESQGATYQGDHFAKSYGTESILEGNVKALKFSAMHLITPDDPPIFMKYGMAPDQPWPDPNNPKFRGFLVHHVSFGIQLKKKADTINTEAHLKYPGAQSQYDGMIDFLIKKLIDSNPPSEL